ncbi:kinase/pyrophosphorylase, partial [Enterococcus lactis]|uniref:kinase/pyrophosphorylase n=1 Tax=Enterococcus lactis TaxID=357441 RepID=UPI0022DF9BE0
MSSDSTEIVTFFVISDSAGETATKLAQATMAQYPSVEFNLFRRTFVTDEKTLMQALQDALKEKALVLHTLINQELIEMTRSFCEEHHEEHQLFSFDVMTPPISEIERLTGIKPIRQPGALHLLNENY